MTDYFNLNDTTEYDFILKNLKPKNYFQGGSINFNKLTYKEVIICFDLISKLETKEILAELFKIAFAVDNFFNASIDEFYSARNYLLKAFLELKEKQRNLLTSASVDINLWEASGGARLNRFNDLMPLVQLGEIYSIFPHDLMNRPYNDIFVLLVLHKEKGEVTNEFNRLKQKQK